LARSSTSSPSAASRASRRARLRRSMRQRLRSTVASHGRTGRSSSGGCSIAAIAVSCSKSSASASPCTSERAKACRPASSRITASGVTYRACRERAKCWLATTPARSCDALRRPGLLLHVRKCLGQLHLTARVEDQQHVDDVLCLAAGCLDDQLGVTRKPHDRALLLAEVDLHVAR